MSPSAPVGAGFKTSRTARHNALLLVGILVVVTLIALPILSYPMGRDQGGFATIGRGILDGRTIYVDLWDVKPPATFYVYAADIAVFGRSAAALRLMDLILYPLVGIALYWIGRRIAGARIGLWAALLFGVFYFTETFWTLTQSDGIVLVPMLLALICACKAADASRRSALWALASGALTASCIWFKYPFIIFSGGVVFTYVWLRIRQNAPLRRLDILLFIVGGLLVGVLGIAYMAAIGAWDALLESARISASYAGQGAGDLGEALGFRWQHWGLLFVITLIAVIAGIRRFNRRSLWWIVVVWLLICTAILALQLKFFDYHWLPMLPPLVLIGAGGIEGMFDLIGNMTGRVSKPILRGVIVLVLIGAMGAAIWSLTLPYLTGQEDQLAYYHHFQAGEYVADESQAVADFLRQRVAPGDSLFIWGFRPEVYFLSQLNPAVRFIQHQPLVAAYSKPEWRQETVDILWAALPPYVLVLQGDYLPWVTGVDEDSNTLLQDYTELNNWLEYNYERDSQIGNFLIWRRISTPK